MRPSDIGRAELHPRRPVCAGSDVTLTLTYVAGRCGIDDLGSIKIVWREMSDAGQLQWHDPQAPNYVSFRTTGQAVLSVRSDGHIRPWREGLRIKVTDGFLRPGDRIIVVFGDRRGGSVGWRMQTFCEKRFEFHVLADPFGTRVYERVKPSPGIRIIPGRPARLVAVAPTAVAVGEPFKVRLVTKDVWGNPAGRVRRRKHRGFDRPGTYVLPFRDTKTGLSCETNPIVVRERVTVRHWWADFHAQSAETIGTGTVAVSYTHLTLPTN